MSDNNFLMSIGEARYRLERLYYEKTPWKDLDKDNIFWHQEQRDMKMEEIRIALEAREEELFEILMLMNPSRDK